MLPYRNFNTALLLTGVRTMLNVQSRSYAFARPLSTCLFAAALSVALAACGGGEDGASGVAAAQAAASAATAASAPSVINQIAALERREMPLSAMPSSKSAVEGVRPDVAAFIAALALTDPQRVVLHQAARALQATLTVKLTRRAELQTAVNGLIQATACMRAHFTGGEAVWRALQARSHNTLARRFRHALFLVASRLLAQRQADVVCTSVPPAGGDGGSSGPPPTPPPTPTPPTPTPPTPPTPPNAAQQLHEEIARLEQQGVLPTLDRGTDIRGPDANDNGVRDDIEAYIAALPITTAQNRAAMQRARNQQAKLLLNPVDKQAVVYLSEQSIAATKCMADVFEGAATDWSDDLTFKIGAITANTPERAKRYMQYMAALSGTSVSYPRGNTCEE